MSICVCCSRGMNHEWSESHKRCPRCIQKRCTSQDANCGIERPKQHPEENREVTVYPDEESDAVLL